MGKEMDTFHRFMQKELEARKPNTDEEYSAAIQEIMMKYNTSLRMGTLEKTNEDLSDEYLEKAQKAKTPNTRIKHLKKALELNPRNVDAAMSIAFLENSDNPIKVLEAYDKVIETEKQYLKKDDYFKQDMGDFWLVFETRPYMRALRERMAFLLEVDRTTDAIKQGEEILRLNTNDNQGVRYKLMALYAQQENLKSSLFLLKKYKNEDSVGLMLPIAICCYRLGKYEECDEYLMKAYQRNKHLFKVLLNPEYETMDISYYSPGKESEVVMALNECFDLIDATKSFFDYLDKFKDMN